MTTIEILKELILKQNKEIDGLKEVIKAYKTELAYMKCKHCPPNIKAICSELECSAQKLTGKK